MLRLHRPLRGQRKRDHVEPNPPPERARTHAGAAGRTSRVLPPLWRAAHAHVRRSGYVAAVRELSRRGPARRDGAVLPAARVRLRSMSARAAAGVRQPRDDLPRVRLLLVVFRQLGRPRARLHGPDNRAAAAEPRQLRGGSRERSEEHTSELQSQSNIVCRLLLEKKKNVIYLDMLS